MEQTVYSMILADDEPLARRAFRTLIERTFPNIEIAAELTTGQEAVDYVSEHNIDIAVLDVKMPGMDGIETAATILRHKPQTQVFLLTAHERFTFAQRAIDAGVKGYLLKPATASKVETKISAAIAEINHRKLAQESAKTTASKVRGITPFVESRVVAGLSTGERLSGEVKAFLEFLALDYHAGCILCVDFAAQAKDHIGRSEGTRALGFGDVFTRLGCLTTDQLYSDITAFIPISRKYVTSEMLQQIKWVAEEVHRKIKAVHGVETLVGVGSIEAELTELPNSYAKAIRALSSARLQSPVIHFDDKMATQRQRDRRSIAEYRLEDELLEAVNLEQLEKARVLVTKLSTRIIGSSVSFEEQLERLFPTLILLKRRAAKLSIPIGELSDLVLLDELRSVSTPEQLGRRFLARANQMLKEIGTEGDRGPGLLLRRAQKFISDHPYSEITLEQVAEAAGVSSQYLSRLFKTHAGERFIDYVTKLRIQEAQRKLVGTDETVKQIGLDVGYTDPNYFSQVFRKLTGFSPNQYRSLHSTAEQRS